ncbi:hypothetical protein [Halorussus sp. MSC15.2]|uniref:hypothetical protein n=1 Tax=Halorussus sp. MSC15.2 TaxID=2283638 RepID=UPI0013D04ADC|nr:hypothetical protein [Halorussus sp. MSC15.2]NEU55310.1 hypothetical protein [Halorussus sp. MSC15.2]
MTAEETLDEPPASDESTDERSHLEDVEDGAGCTEIWEHLSERREDETDEE